MPTKNAVKKVLILVGAGHKHEKNYRRSDLPAKVDQLIPGSVEVEFAGLNEFVFIADREPEIYHFDKKYDMADFDFVVIRSVGEYVELAIAAAHYLHYKGVDFSDSYLLMPGRGKLSCSFQRLRYDLPTIKTIYAASQNLLQGLESIDDLGMPYILKADIAKKGDDNYLINSAEEAERAINSSVKKEAALIAQPFIKNEGDYRILVLDYKPRLAMLRRGRAGSHLNSTSQGGSASQIPLDQINEEILSDAVAAARLEKLEVAGVDVIVDAHTGKHYILEVNRSPQIPTGEHVDKKINAFADYIAEKVISGTNSRVSTEHKIIGSFEAVKFPEFGNKSVVAKIDTGAYTGALHCMDIKEEAENGVTKLAFKPLSSDKYYKTANYLVKHVRSSNGRGETRYFITTSILIREEKYEILLSLANRNEMRWPILIGRRFLKRNNFLIDPSIVKRYGEGVKRTGKL